MKHHLKLRDWVDINKLNWVRLSENPNAIHLLERNIDKIEWDWLSRNPSIFEYDYKSMTERCDIYKEELIANRFHPKNLSKFKEWGFDD